MKLSTRKDIDAPAEAVFARLSDFDAIEDGARANGAEITRTRSGEGPLGEIWDVSFDYAGRRRSTRTRLVTYDPPTQIAARADLDGLTAMLNFEVLELGPDRSRLFAAIELKPSSIKGRLLVRSLRLAKGKLEKRLDKRLERFAQRLSQTAGA